MDTISSHTSSAALHAAFLLICFAVPRDVAVTALAADMRFERWVETRIVRVDEPIERMVRVEVRHVEDLALGSGVGSSGGAGAGPAWGGGVGEVARAPRPGPPRRSESTTRAPETHVAEGGAVEGEEGPDEATSDRVTGELTDGADGGGGNGHASKANPEGGEGFGGEGSSSGCGCDSGPVGMGIGMGMIGSLGLRTRGSQVTPNLERTPDSPRYIIPSVVTRKPVISCDGCAAVIERVIRAHLREVRYCYELSLERDPRLEGELMLSLSIPSRGGLPTEVEASSSAVAAPLEACVEKRMRRWYFPPLAHDARANFPVRLTSAPQL